MQTLDWAVLIGTLIFIVFYGIWKNKNPKNINEYLKAGNQSRWWTVGLSVMATQASAITFLSTPGQAFNDGMGFIQFYFGLPFAMVIICLFFIPIYNRLKIYTAYEFLENRFDKRVRTLTASLFLMQRGLAAGITIYAPAIILSVVLNWDLRITALVVGSLVILYTLVGGTRAVNMTQKLQMFIIFSGMFIAFYFIIISFPNQISFLDAISIAGKAEKLNFLDFSINLKNRYTFWSGITGGLFLSLSYFGTDQSQVQRYLSGRSIKESQMGLIMNGFLKVPMQFFILFTGVMVFVFYQFEPAPLNFNPKAILTVKESKQIEEFSKLEIENMETQKQIRNLLLNNGSSKEIDALRKKELKQRGIARDIISKSDPKQETNDKDYIFISFILSHLPVGLIGLLIAVILSASMSSTASELNALAATSTIDLYKRNYRNKTEKTYLKTSKMFTLVWGLIAILFACFGNLFENLIQLINIIGSIFYGTILGIFLVGIFNTSIKGRAIFWAAIISEIFVITIFVWDKIGFLWLNLIGALGTIFMSSIIQYTFYLKSKK
ncbi:MAG: sodium:solute symporter [Flavobacteriaceae bacterium TMED68]|nr:MAG: sodium:solute symporter [Flavobacteriaceae bacterium TMED68]|tara:strand:+ start:22998 stop:24650 length:1653 start_codon:yes stop_codon:yes gene_type:complete